MEELIEGVIEVVGSVAEVLTDAGYTVVEGIEDTLSAIASVADGFTAKRCSGYGVFPDGTKCKGCDDCRK